MKHPVSADMLEHALQDNPSDLVFNDDSEIAQVMKKDQGFGQTFQIFAPGRFI